MRESFEAIRDLRDAQMDYDLFEKAFKVKRSKRTKTKNQQQQSAKSNAEQGSQVLVEIAVSNPSSLLALIGGETK
ncbi:MAG: hypothetical protein JRN68_03310 [Nitrososphaerota archaeon]|nr:hypothetical protein [Nitrososphaerota archaeon]